MYVGAVYLYAFMRPFREVGTSKQLEVLEPEKTEVAPLFHERTLSPRSPMFLHGIHRQNFHFTEYVLPGLCREGLLPGGRG